MPDTFDRHVMSDATDETAHNHHAARYGATIAANFLGKNTARKTWPDLLEEAAEHFRVTAKLIRHNRNPNRTQPEHFEP